MVSAEPGSTSAFPSDSKHVARVVGVDNDCAPDAWEPNNHLGVATLAPSVPLDAELCYGDLDVFGFQVPPGRRPRARETTTGTPSWRLPRPSPPSRWATRWMTSALARRLTRKEVEGFMGALAKALDAA